jgi:putative tryptophan/tyrosine transport system substrate-binding protein
MPVVGFLGSDSPKLYADRLRAFRRGLKDAGYVESENVVIEYRWANGDNNRLAALAAELVGLRVNVLVSGTTPAALALKAATTSIPIVFFTAGDPVALGLVGSLNRPGANITGTTALTLEAGKKWLQLLQETVPSATEFAVLINPTSPNLAEAQTKDMQAAARNLNLRIHLLNASTEHEFETVFAKITELRAGGLVITSDSFFFAHIEKLAALAAQNKAPAIFGFREFPAAGGLMSYGSDLADPDRTIGGYVGRILKGEKPGDLPVQQSIKVQLVLNLRAAKTLGITLPQTLQVAADEVIE